MRKRRRRFTPTQLAEMWTQWQAGETLAAISDGLALSPSGMFRVVQVAGGICPAPRCRHRRHLSLAERQVIERAVAAKLVLDWSPAQIAAWLVQRYPEDLTMRVSAETIYQSLYVQARGALRHELAAHLRRGQTMRRSRGNRRRTTAGGGLVGAVSIRERPPEAADRAVPGHWEGDLLAGAGSSHIATLVERSLRYVLLVKVPSKDSTRVARALARRIKRLPASLKASLTWDRGSELTQHAAFTLATDVAVYFCDPRRPWQRGSNENTNGLLRRYFPKGWISRRSRNGSSMPSRSA